jgi:hypothetical protein
MRLVSTVLDCADPDLSIGTVTKAIGRVWRRVATRAVCLGCTWRHVRLSSTTDLPLIVRSVPYKPDSEIIFPDVATMKALKRLTTILKA